MPTPTLREQMAHKRAHREYVRFPLGAAGEQALTDLEQAQRDLQVARVTGAPPEAVAAGEKRVAKLERLYYRPQTSMLVIVRGLNDEERDALASAHPPTEEQQAEDQERITAGKIEERDRRTLNNETWLPAALAAAVVDSDLTEEEWAVALKDPEMWTSGEKIALQRAVVTATNGGPSPGTPFV
jgi:hypothetical protein